MNIFFKISWEAILVVNKVKDIKQYLIQFFVVGSNTEAITNFSYYSYGK